MGYVFAVILTLLVVAPFVWFLAGGRIRTQYSTRLSEAQNRASTTEGRLGAIQGELEEARNQNQKLTSDLAGERETRIKAETQLTEALKRVEEEKRLLEEAKGKLSDAFKSLARDTLDGNTRAFLELAKGTFDKLLTEAKGDLGKRQEAINGLVKPLSDALTQFEAHVRDLEKTRQAAYTGLETNLKTLVVTQQKLEKETGNLVSALRTPTTRGKWGEVTLKRVVELAGMCEYCDFTEQVTTSTENGVVRPDMIVHLPSERDIVIDAKVPLTAYLSAISAESEQDKAACLLNHARQVRNHMEALAKKAYWQQFQRTPEFVVMFIPGESFLSIAAEQDHALLEDGMQKQVIVATPTTLIALLKAIAYGWRQEQIARNASEISELGQQLYTRMRILAEHMLGVGKGLGKAVEAYNDAVGSMESRVFPAARRFKDLRAASEQDIPALPPLGTSPRSLVAPELEGNSGQTT